MQIPKDIQLKIIIVDDNKDDHFFIKKSMEEYPNITFVSLYDGESFLKYLTQRTHTKGTLPDIVILDINMPKLNGFECYEYVKRLGLLEGTAFYILSSSITDADHAKCRDLNLDCNIKPFSIMNFTRVLERMIKDYLTPPHNSF